MKILVCNVGSTSLKFKLFDMPENNVLAQGKIERVGSLTDAIFHYRNCNNGFEECLEEQCIRNYTDGIQMFLKYLLDREQGVLNSIDELERIGFKTVLAKGYLGVHELTADVIKGMEDYLVVAPVHNTHYLEAIREFKKILPDTLLVGVFETDFHRTIPEGRSLYAIPYEWYKEYGIKRLGYHGASHRYIASTISETEGKEHRLISCHLGGSSSLCAIKDGLSVDTSFGFSLQTGIIHANRVGDLDGYVIPYLLSVGLTMDEILEGLDQKGGLLGLSGVSNDLRFVKDAEEEGNPRAKLAIDVFCNGIVKYIGAFYAELGGLDHLVFTGGIGENADYIRSNVCNQLEHLGIDIDEDKNLSGDKNRVISKADSKVKVHIIPTDEEQVIAKRTYEYIG